MRNECQRSLNKRLTSCARSAIGVHIRIDHVTHRYIKHLRHFEGSFIPVVLKEDGQEAKAQEEAVHL